MLDGKYKLMCQGNLMYINKMTHCNLQLFLIYIKQNNNKLIYF